MQDVIRSNRKTTGGKESVDWRILLVDQLSMRMVSACCKMHEIAAEGITCKLSSTWFHFSSPNWILCTVVEDLNKKREPIPSMEAIYLITPCDSSVRGLMNDFQSPSRAKYKCCHIYFTEGSIQKKNCLEKKKGMAFYWKKKSYSLWQLVRKNCSMKSASIRCRNLSRLWRKSTLLSSLTSLRFVDQCNAFRSSQLRQVFFVGVFVR